MNLSQLPRQQSGVVTIFVCMVLLLLITGIITTALSMSTTNLRAVGNVQARDEALSSASVIIENVISSSFATDIGGPAAAVINDFGVDLDKDSVNDYLVNMPAPVCVRATPAIATSFSSVQLPGMSSVTGWNTVWELDVTATAASTGAKIRVIHGVRVLLTDTQKLANCS
ncbi:MAG: hypothetical protein V7696_15675 [Halioglobus sp.]